MSDSLPGIAATLSGLHSERGSPAACDAQHQQSPIGQSRLGHFYPLTQLHQIAREATIIERTQFHLHGVTL
jgi:hypothetical protein